MTPENEFRSYADECRQLSRQATDSNLRAQWLKLAEHWQRMAEEAHKRPDAFVAE